MPSREYDIVLFGATGFVGQLTAAYLAEHAPTGTRWAIAGRTKAKLETLRAGLAATHPDTADLPVLVADSNDAASLRRLAESTRVLVTTVGPYVLYGDALVAACADAGTDYLDLTGEPEFVNNSYLRYHDRAVRSGARLVHCAGFDVIPADAGAFFTLLQLPEDVPVTINGYVRSHAQFSGGTFHSAITGFARPRQNAEASKARKQVEPPRDPSRRAHVASGKPHRDPVDGRWAVPLPTIDPSVVVRTARTLPRYGPDFTYSHFASAGKLATAAGGVAGVAALVAAVQVPPVRRAVLSRLKPGEGPSADRRARSWFTLTFVGEGGGQRVVTRVSGGDPGYDETAKMLGESALCLAFDELPETSGQVTPVTAMGEALVHRLQAAGMTFEVLSRGEAAS